MYELGQPSVALPCLLTADLLNPDQSHIVHQIGACLGNQGHPERARAFFRRALALDPGNQEAREAVSGRANGEPTVTTRKTLALPDWRSSRIPDTIRNLDSGDGSLVEEYAFLYGICCLLRPNLVLETGTNTGVSSIVLACAMRDSHMSSRIVTVENDGEVLRRARDQVERCGLTEFIEFVEGESLKALPIILKKYARFDLCFLDGGHDYEVVRGEFELVKHHCRYLMLHDSQLFEGVRQLVAELAECSDYQVIQLAYPPGVQWSEGLPVLSSSPGLTIVEVVRERDNRPD